MKTSYEIQCPACGAMHDIEIDSYFECDSCSKLNVLSSVIDEDGYLYEAVEKNHGYRADTIKVYFSRADNGEYHIWRECSIWGDDKVGYMSGKLKLNVECGADSDVFQVLQDMKAQLKAMRNLNAAYYDNHRIQVRRRVNES